MDHPNIDLRSQIKRVFYSSLGSQSQMLFEYTMVSEFIFDDMVQLSKTMNESAQQVYDDVPGFEPLRSIHQLF